MRNVTVLQEREGIVHRRASRRLRHGKLVTRALVLLAVLAGGVIMLVPFVFMVSISFDKDATLTIPFPPHIIPPHATGENYAIAFQSIDLVHLYANTIEVAFGTLICGLGSSLLAGYALSKLNLRGGHFILILALATLMIPSESTIIPLFLVFKDLGLLNNYGAFYLSALAYPFGAFLIKQYMDGLPNELREAAIVDGAGELRVLWSIYLPLCKGVLATITVLMFLDVWNSYLWPLILLSDPSKYTIQIGLATFNITNGQGQSTALPAVNMAATVLSLLPILAVFLFFQRYIVEGIASAGLKG